MDAYTVFNSAGEIVRSGQTLDAQLHPLKPGEQMHVGAELSAKTHYFRDGQPVAYTDAQRAARAQRPQGRRCRWSLATMSWEDLTTLADAKGCALAALTTERDRRLAAPVTHQGRKVDADGASWGRVARKLEELRNGSPRLLAWRDAANGQVTFSTPAEMRRWMEGLAAAISARETDVMEWSWAQKTAIAGAPDVAAVEKIVAGWQQNVGF